MKSALHLKWRHSGAVILALDIALSDEQQSLSMMVNNSLSWEESVGMWNSRMVW